MSRSLTSNWNTEQGYEKSSKVNETTSLSDTISNVINKRWQYSSTVAEGGSKSNALSSGESHESRDEYISTVEYSEEETKEIETVQTIHRNESGYYRLVNAGTVHVFGVVGYDIATNSYFAYTYNVLDKERHIFVDFSVSTALFDDCQNAIIPFEIPAEVNDYVSRIMGGTDGLSINKNGIISEPYTGNAEYVVIPQYVSIKNTNNTYSAVRVRGITSDVFKGNKNIKGVILSKYISEIPDGAFEGCTSLETVQGYGITAIGNNAFKDCTSLKKFDIDKYVTVLGNNAFENVGEIEVKAGNPNVAEAAVNSGAKRISLDLSAMSDPDDMFKDKTLAVGSSTDFFNIMSNDRAYSNISIKSDAKETVISNIIFKNNTNTPIETSSDKLTLGSVVVENCSGMAMILKADNTELALFAATDLNSDSENTAISKNVTLKKADPSVTSVLKVNKTYLVCGTMKNQSMFEGNLKDNISENEYNQWLTPEEVRFDANGGVFGSSEDEKKVVYRGRNYGVLPSVTRENYDFTGWYTEIGGGEIVTSDTIVTKDGTHTLYAHWTQRTFTAVFDANGGYASTPSKPVTYGQSYGTLPTPSRDYYEFLGWYTQASNGDRVTSDSIFTGNADITLYAHWKLKDTSGWVPRSSMPSDAQIVNTKWTYTEKSYKDSRNEYESGYTLSSSEWVWCGSGSRNYADFPSGFDTGSWYYQNWNGGAFGAYENNTDKRDVSNSWSGYIYWHWMYDCGGAGAYTRAIWNRSGYCSVNTYGYRYFGAFDSATNYDVQGYNQYCNNCGMTTYKVTDRPSNADSQGSYFWFRFDYYTSTYNDYYKLFHYYREDSRESYSQPYQSSTVYNITEWVQYRAK